MKTTLRDSAKRRRDASETYHVTRVELNCIVSTLTNMTRLKTQTEARRKIPGDMKQ